MRINTRSKVTVVAGILGIAALFGSVVSTAVGGALAVMPDPAHPAHVVAMAPQVMPDPAQPQEMPQP
jgi:hypothetical protein